MKDTLGWHVENAMKHAKDAGFPGSTRIAPLLPENA